MTHKTPLEETVLGAVLQSVHASREAAAMPHDKAKRNVAVNFDEELDRLAEQYYDAMFAHVSEATA